jgi:peptide-methionine (R)-S-oxide reductase
MTQHSIFALVLALALCLSSLPVDGFGGIHGFVGSAKKGPPVILRMSEKGPITTASDSKEGPTFPIEKTDDEWKELLTPDQYYILRKEGTETPGASVLNQISVEKNGPADAGTFCCAGCGNPLFLASAKYDSGTGWPSFFQPLANSAVGLRTDYKLVVPRTECVCSRCGGHLGHVFEGA